MVQQATARPIVVLRHCMIADFDCDFFKLPKTIRLSVWPRLNLDILKLNFLFPNFARPISEISSQRPLYTVPALHFEQEVDPVLLAYVPAGQGGHVFPPLARWYEPGLQSEQDVDPAWLAQVPGAHFSHFVLLVTLQKINAALKFGETYIRILIASLYKYREQFGIHKIWFH